MDVSGDSFEVRSDSMDDDGSDLISQFSSVGLHPQSCSKCTFLSLEEFEEATATDVGERVVSKANAAIQKLRAELHKQKTRADTAEITMSQLLDQIDRESKETRYKEELMELRREHNKLVLKSMQVEQELTELKKATGHAITAIGDAGKNQTKAAAATSRMDMGAFAADDDELNAPTGQVDVFNEISALMEDMDRKMTISTTEVNPQDLRVMISFFERLKEEKRKDQMRISEQISILDDDIRRVGEQLHKVEREQAELARNPFDRSRAKLAQPKRERKRKMDAMDDGDMLGDEDANSIAVKRNRVLTNLDALGESYFQSRQADESGLGAFQEQFSELTRYNELQVLGTFMYAPESGIIQRNQTSIVSSVAFHSSEDFFAVGGTLGEIHVMGYDLDNIQHEDQSLSPLLVMKNGTKISCVGYNPLKSEQLASTDYDGVVCLWDTNQGRTVTKYKEHRKRTWCVDWSLPQPGLFATASEDYTVKLWHCGQSTSHATIRASSEVCSVAFNRTLENQLAFSCADHKAYYYDIRNTSTPLSVLHGHRKTVCDVGFLTREELITQSIDSTLKLWNLQDRDKVPRQTFIGHENKMRFTGMDCAHELIACGSETNSVMIYVRSHNKPILTHSFATLEKEKDYGAFVSAVTWRRNSKVLIVGNSRGIVKVLGLV